MMYIIAEIGINHNGDMNLAHELIRQAAIAGASAGKFQSYSTSALFGVSGQDPNEEIYNGVKHMELSKDDLVQLKAWCNEEHIDFMCSVFDEERLGWIEEIGVSMHKIASRVSKLNRPLAQKIIDTGKECIMSLGFGSERFEDKHDNLKYLHCVSEYPTEYSNINMPVSFSSKYGDYYGFSDHSIGSEAALVAAARGARVIEKHFTLSKASIPNFDHVCSLIPSEMADLVKYSKLMQKVVR